MSISKIVLVAFVWLALLSVGVGVWKLFVQPEQQARETERKKEQDQQSLDATKGTSRYQYDLACGLDAFSGYAVLRSPDFRDQLARQGIRMEMVDDNADYAKRMDALESGEIQLAAFPVDALLKISAQRNRLPATIIAIIDETRGADGMLAYKQRYPDVDSLNSPDTRFVLVGDSPSETLTRVVMHDFDLSRLSKDPMQRVASADAIIQAYRKATPSTNEVFVTWEPFISQLLENDQLHVLVDSSKFTGYIVDAIVVSRDFLLKEQEVVEKILESYFRSMNAFRDPAQMKELVLADAKLTNTSLTSAQADRLLKGIQWKNTQENYAHFGLRAEKVVHIEDILGRISSVLVSSGGIEKDPTDGQFSRLFFDRPLAKLQSTNFLPEEVIRQEQQLVELSESQWSTLVPVGTLSVPELVFARGTANLSEVSRTVLDELAEKLRSWPAYYLRVEGNASSSGNIEANLSLAARRAEATVEYLKALGIPAARMKSVSGKAGQSRVVFTLGELPY
ncbi:MAG: phosphate ABC transporter substrate-binding/OmpA family protein [Planctomycetota bacterium]|nr:phosphate ABC transporter substrate-binding/OmpA family protein [Planctomycetota bacterium]